MMDRYEAATEPRRLGRLLVHELAHIEQFRRLGALRHVGQYAFDYLWGRTPVRLEDTAGPSHK